MSKAHGLMFAVAAAVVLVAQSESHAQTAEAPRPVCAARPFGRIGDVAIGKCDPRPSRPISPVCPKPDRNTSAHHPRLCAR